MKTAVAREAHHCIAGDGRGQQEETEEIATPHELFEQSTF
jgi:hypothetical protein